MTYIHERADWPNLRWSDEQLAQPLAAVRHRQGRLIGHMEALGFPLREEAVLQALRGLMLPKGKGIFTGHAHIDALERAGPPSAFKRLQAAIAQKFGR